MSVVGIDLGAQSTKVGVARNKGIDIVRLPYSSFFCCFLLCVHGMNDKDSLADSSIWISSDYQ